MSGGPSTLQQRDRKRAALQSDEENSENGEDDSEDNSEDDSDDDSDDDEPEYSDGPEYGGDSYGRRAMRRGAKRSKGATRNGPTTEFAKVKNAKPRQTHSAE